MKIAVILTCHNRCNKTVSSLKSLYLSLLNYNKSKIENINLEIFLTDDGCTDNTVKEVKKELEQKIPITIIKGDGNRYWAGGMRDAWNEALKGEWDYFLLLNDDTVMKDTAFIELFKTHEYSINTYNKEGIYSGITSSFMNENEITYGGDIWVNRLLCKAKRLQPKSVPQMCDMTNANILLVPKSVVCKIGIFNNHYLHGFADYDYSMEARKHDIPVLITPSVCGKCENDHPDANLVDRACSMKLDERRRLFENPLHSSSDYLYFVKRFTPLRFPLVYIGRKMIVYFPYIYRILYNLRVK